MAGVVTASLVVQFGDTDSEQYTLQAEVDARDDGFNKGVTQFLPGDSPAFLVYKSPELTLSFEQSTGNRSSLGSVTIPQEEFLVFANENTAQLSKPPEGSVTLKRLAGVSGAVLNRQEVRIPEKGVAVYKATYNARAYAYRMTGIPTSLQGETSFPVVVVIIGTAL